MDKENKDIQNNIEEANCWICKRGFDDAIEEFNKRVLSNKFVDDEVKSGYEKGKKEFFPLTAGNYLEFELADIEEDGSYSTSGKVLGEIFIWLCPVCSGLLESLSQNIDLEDYVTKEDLEDVSISIRQKIFKEKNE